MKEVIRTTKTKQISDKELARLEALYELQCNLNEQGQTLVVGVDEVGRGSLAGPVSAGACILPTDSWIEGINDSKKLSPARRAALYDQIVENCLHWSVAHVPAVEIDAHGIVPSLHRAMRLAVDSLDVIPEVVFADGIPLHLWANEICIVKGDAKVACISAASILAKVERDRLMIQLDSEYPEYGFASHKGYGAAAHIAAVKKHGLCEIHRASFCSNIVAPTLFL